MGQVTAKQLQDMKDKIEGTSKQADVLEGRVQEKMAQLKKDFGFSTLRLAERELAKLEKGLESATEALEKSTSAFDQAYGEMLE